MSSPRRAAAPAALTASFVRHGGTSAEAACNDNGVDPAGDALLRAALRLFAAHGLGAGHRAQEQAEAAFFAGERERYRWWLAVTRTLDRKLAIELAGRMGSDLFGSEPLRQR